MLVSNLDHLDWPHVEIFDAAMKMDFRSEDLDAWLEIFRKMKKHFLISLCFRDFSLTAIRIMKKFLFHPVLQVPVLEECQEIFIKTLALIYQPDREVECKENARDALEHLHEGISE